MSEARATPTRRRSDVFYAAGLVAVTLLAFWPLLARQQSLFRPALFGNDWQGAYVPAAGELAQMVRAGFLPLWTPTYLTGVPLLGMGQSGYLYPPTYFYTLAPFFSAYAAVLLGQLALLALFTYAALRAHAFSGHASFLASLWMVLAGPVLWMSFEPTNFQGVPWFVLLYVAVLGWMKQPRGAPWLLFVAALSLEILSGDPEVTVYACLAIALVVAGQLGLARVPLRRAGLLLFGLAAGGALSGLLTLALSLPTLEFFSHCIRTTAFDYQAYRDSWPAGGEVLGLLGLMVQRRTGEFYFSLLPLALAGLGLAWTGNSARRELRWLVLGAMLLGLLIAFNRTLHLTPLLYHLPVFSLLNRHFKLLPFFQFFLCLGIALGVEALAARPRRLGWVFGLVGLGLFEILLPDRPWPFRLALGLGYLLVLAAGRAKVRSGWLVAALIAVSLTDVGSKTWGPAIRLEYPRFAASFHRFFASADRGYRTVVLYPLADRLSDSVPPVPFQAGFWEGTSTLDQWFHLPNTRYLQFLSRLNPAVMQWRDGKLVNHFIDAAFKHQDFVTPQNRHLVDYLNLRYFVSYRVPLASVESPDSGLVLRVRDEIDIYENLAALPRAFLVHGVRYYPEEGRLLEDLGDADRFQPAAQVLLSGPGRDRPPQPAQPGEHVEALDYQWPRSRYRVTLHEPGFLATSENHLPGWRAWVDGVESPVLRANYTFRALALEPGAHLVEFRYAPFSFRLGLWAALAALGGFVAAAVIYFAPALRGRRPPAGLPGAGP